MVFPSIVIDLGRKKNGVKMAENSENRCVFTVFCQKICRRKTKRYFFWIEFSLKAA